MVKLPLHFANNIALQLPLMAYLRILKRMQIFSNCLYFMYHKLLLCINGLNDKFNRYKLPVYIVTFQNRTIKFYDGLIMKLVTFMHHAGVHFT